MFVLGVIPARGGSKGIPRKNIAPLAGRPLIAWTASAALAAKRLSRVLVSTDDQEIADVARAAGLEVPFLRPAALAGDSTSALPVIQHAIGWMEAQGTRVDALAYLQPTSPFRPASAIDAAVDLLDATQADTVVSVVEVPHNMTPNKLMRLEDDGSLQFMAPDSSAFDRQSAPRLHARNGPAVLLGRRAVFMDQERLYGDKVVPLVMTQQQSIDIDMPDDLSLAESIAAGRTVQSP